MMNDDDFDDLFDNDDVDGSDNDFAEIVLGLAVLRSIANVLPMIGTYDERLVDNYTSDDDKFSVDTCAVTDAPYPFETALRHPAYNDGEWIIVESYDDYDSAKTGHEKWVDMLLSDTIPYNLIDVSDNLFVAVMEMVKGSDDWRNNKRNAWIDEKSDRNWDL